MKSSALLLAAAATLATCAHSELGFIRVSMQVLRLTLAEAREAQATIKKSMGGFIAEAPAPRLGAWARKATRASDVHLVQLAASAGLALVTLDNGIPDAVRI